MVHSAAFTKKSGGGPAVTNLRQPKASHMATEPYRIGIDLGGTKTEAIVLDADGCERHRKRVTTPRKSGTDEYSLILANLCNLITETTRRIPNGARFTIGIGMPGSLDPDTELIRNANTTCLNGQPLKADIEKRVGRPVALENDANCFTLAESVKGVARSYRLVFGIIMGTGCGGGICIDGRTHKGLNRIGGEWGHFVVDPQGAPCYCGNRGCIETKISGAGVENAYFARYQDRLRMDEILVGYRNKDPRCSEIFLQFLDDFGRAVGGLISLLDPDVVVIGGGLSKIDELYSLGVERMRRYAFHPQVTTPILKNELGDSAGVFGAAWIGR